MSNMSWIKIIGVGALGALAAGAAIAQGGNGWNFECTFFSNPPQAPPYPFSDDYGLGRVRNTLISVSLGHSGTEIWGGTMGPCYAPARTLAAAGRLAFQIGSEGSVQDTFDDGLAVTTGAPQSPVGDFTYARILFDGTSELFGANGLRGFYTGASNRYHVLQWNNADTDVQLTARVIGDAVRLEWVIRNLHAESHRLGLKYGSYVGMRTRNAGVTEPGTSYNQAHSLLGTNTGIPKFTAERYIGYTFLPTSKPARTERNYLKSSPKFPAYVNFEFGQSYPYGLKVENVPSESIKDATPADQFLIGNQGGFTQPGLLWNNVMRSRVFTDNGQGDPLVDAVFDPVQEEADILLNETAFIQGFAPTAVAAGGTKTIVQYIRSPWSVGNYLDPFTVLVDAPRLLPTDVGAGSTHGLAHNPFPIRAYIDNQYARIDQEVTLNNVQVTLTLPASMRLVAPPDGGNVAPPTQILGRVGPNVVAFVDWWVEADGNSFGYQPYSVKFESVPGPVKVLNGQILVSATAQLRLPDSPTLVTLPWSFADSSLDAILGLVSGRDYIALKWDTDQQIYKTAISAERGRGIWIIPTSDLGYRALNNATIPPDQATGGLIFNLRPGWNLIGNPYSIAVPLKDLVAVSESDPRQSYTWIDLVQQGRVSSSLAYFDMVQNRYLYTQGSDALLQPHTGYWLFVSDGQAIRLVWPPVFAEGLPNSGRGVDDPWKAGGKRWRLQLSARTSDSLDSENYVGVVANTKDVKMWQIRKPPLAPKAKVELAIEDSIDGKTVRMAQAVTEQTARKEWKVSVRAEQPGEVTVTWPNISNIPRNVRFRLLDTATNATRDLRVASGYTIRMDRAGTRELKIQMEPGGSSRPVIGNVIVSQPNRSHDRTAPFTINYSISAEATTTIRILAGSGKEVYMVTRGRADRIGENNAVWALRDSANRAVAPGSYRVEIVAETQNGDRVRKIVPINVIR